MGDKAEDESNDAEAANPSVKDMFGQLTESFRTMSMRLEQLENKVGSLETGQSIVTRPSTVENGETFSRNFVKLENPDAASKRDLNLNIRAATAGYKDMNPERLRSSFQSYFDSWEQKHFEACDKSIVRELRNLLSSKDERVEIAPLLRISEALVRYNRHLHSVSSDNQMDRTAHSEHHRPVVQATASRSTGLFGAGRGDSLRAGSSSG